MTKPKPDALLDGKFEPCAMELTESGITQFVQEDVAYFAKAMKAPDGSLEPWIDGLYAMDDGRLVGVKFWFLATRDAGCRASEIDSKTIEAAAFAYCGEIASYCFCKTSADCDMVKDRIQCEAIREAIIAADKNRNSPPRPAATSSDSLRNSIPTIKRVTEEFSAELDAFIGILSQLTD